MTADPKRALRDRLQAWRRELPPNERVRRSAAIRSLLAAAAPPRGTILAYAALGDEPDLADLLAAWASVERLALTRLAGDGSLEVVAVPDLGRLRPGIFKVPEPPQTAFPVPPGTIAWALVPGVAFDLAGRRLGRGGGHYDRLLPGLACPKIGVAYVDQIVDEVPAGPADARVDAVATEEGIRWIET
jgi:5-formyltetrahydrofolate cyclo-ligase